jgi:hypothetical protein
MVWPSVHVEHLALAGRARGTYLYRKENWLTSDHPLVLLKHTTINLGSAGQGLNLAENGESAVFCCVHFFGIMVGGGVLRHH